MKVHKCYGLGICFFLLAFSVVRAQSGTIEFQDPCTGYTRDSLRYLHLWDKYWDFDNRSQHDSAIAVCRQLINLGEQMFTCRKDSVIYEKYGKAFAGIGYNLMEKGQYHVALQYSKMGYDSITAKFGEFHIRNTEICVGISENYRQRGDFKNAEAWIRKSLYIMTQVFAENHYYFGNNYMNLGDIYFQRGDYKKAIDWYLVAAENYQSSSEGALPKSFLHLGRSFLSLGKLDTAVYFFQKGINQNQKITKKWNYLKEGQLEVALAKAYLMQGNYTLAQHNLTGLLSRNRHRWEVDVVADAYQLLGEIDLRSNRLRSAIDNFQSAIINWDQYYGEGNGKSVAGAQLLAQTFFDLKEFDRAFQQIQSLIIALCQNFNFIDPRENPLLHHLTPQLALLEALHLKAQFFDTHYNEVHDQTYLVGAADTYQTILTLIELMRRSFLWDDSGKDLMTITTPIFEAGMQANLKLYQLTRKTDYFERALIFADLNKDALLWDHVSVNENLSEGDRVRYDSLSREIGFYEELLFKTSKSMPTDSVTIFAWQNRITDLKTVLNTILGKARRSIPGNTDLFSLRELQRAIGKDQLLLSFVMGKEWLTVFEISRDDFSYSRIQDMDDLKALIVSFQNILTHPSSENQFNDDLKIFQKTAYDLFQRTLLPSLKKYDPKKLTFIPHGLLQVLPMDVLLRTESFAKEATNYRDLPYLFKFYSLNCQTSIRSFLGQKNYHREGTNNQYVGFAPTYTGNELTDSSFLLEKPEVEELYGQAVRTGISKLLYNQEEIKSIAALTNGKPFLGEQATESNIKRHIQRADIIHLAMHAMTNDQAPEFSQFLCYQDNDGLNDGLLYAQEIKRLSMKAKLVVLSACNTGAGKIQDGEGVLSLARAFQYAGAKNMVMSLWAANDRSTNLMIQNFFRNLKSDHPLADALVAAKERYLARAKNDYLTHPFYWSGIVLVGDNNLVPLQKPWYARVFLRFILLPALLCLLVIFYRKYFW